MLKFLLLLFLIITGAGYGQYNLYDYSTPHEPDSFPPGINSIETYRYTIKNGKVKRDSILLLSQEYDRELNEIAGVKYQPTIVMHTGEESPYTVKFKHKYRADNKIVSSIEEPAEIRPFRNRKIRADRYYYIITYEEKYTYDDNSNCVKVDQYYRSYDYSTSIKTGDTTSFYFSTRLSTDDFVFDYDNQIIEKFLTVDSTRTIFNLDSKTSRLATKDKHCISCQPRQRNLLIGYNQDGKKSTRTIFNDRSIIDTKTKYSYDKDNRLIEEADSIGYMFQSPILERETVYEYNYDKVKRKTTRYLNHSGKEKQQILVYDLMGNTISTCTITENEKDCRSYEYFYNNINNIERIIYTDTGGQKFITLKKFNERGLVVEEKHMTQDKTVALVRHYYK